MLRIVLHNKACRWKVGVSPTRTSPSLYSSTPKIEKKKQKQRVRAERTGEKLPNTKVTAKRARDASLQTYTWRSDKFSQRFYFNR